MSLRPKPIAAIFSGKVFHNTRKLINILTRADLLLMAVILTASLYSYRLIRELSSSGEMVSIEVNNRPVARYSLKEDRRLTFKGTGGPLVCEIKNQRVRIRESSCPNKVCVKMGWKKQSGEVIACVPNKTLIYVEGKVNEKLNGVDAVSQ